MMCFTLLGPVFRVIMQASDQGLNLRQRKDSQVFHWEHLFSPKCRENKSKNKKWVLITFSCPLGSKIHKKKLTSLNPFLKAENCVFTPSTSRACTVRVTYSSTLSMVRSMFEPFGCLKKEKKKEKEKVGRCSALTLLSALSLG